MLAILLAAALLQATATPDTVAPPGPASVDGAADATPIVGPPASVPLPPSNAQAQYLQPLAPGRQPELWRGARVGMSPAEVKALFPDARGAAARLLTRPPVDNAVVGGRAVWAVDEQVFGYPALATYYFSPSGLLEVVVNLKGLRLRHTRDNVDVARTVRTGLLGYYGPAKVCVDTDRRGLARLDCRWTNRGVQVGLSYLDYGGLGPSLDVAVRAMPPRVRESGAVFARHGVSY